MARRRLWAMSYPFIGSEAVAAGALSKSALRSRYARIFPDVYVNPEADRTPIVLARAGWLWSGRAAVVAGLSAAALYGADWVDSAKPVDLIHGNRNVPSGIAVHGDRTRADELTVLDGIAVTCPERTALDIACWYPAAPALAAIDALLRATAVNPTQMELLAARYPGRRGIRRARVTLGLADGGAQSPKESWLRLVLVEAGLPRPRTQIAVRDDDGKVLAYLDMGWDETKIAVEYDGEQHRTDRQQYIWDLRRHELLENMGWIIVRVVAGDRPVDIVRRVREAMMRRASHPSGIRRSA